MIDDIFLLILKITITVRNSLHKFVVGNCCLVITLDSLLLVTRHLLCEKLEETAPIPTKLVHQLLPDPFTAIDSKLDFGPHWVSHVALLWAIPLLDPYDIPILDLLDDFVEVLGTVKCGNACLAT